jgi:pSer/pThr/pTyr-binding forkhead associated (FHA) protein
MALTVLVRSGDLPSPAAITFDAPRIVIGRGDGCEVRLPDPSVSHRHASVRQRGSDYVIIDEGSTNGTFVGPVRLSPQAPRMIHSGELVRVGRIWLELRVEHSAVTQNPQAATREIALGLISNALVAQGEPSAARVRVEEGPDRGKLLELREFDRRYVIGRGQGADLALDDADAAGRHVEVYRKGQHVYVHDLGSKNGTELGEHKLAAGEEAIWPRRTALRLAGSVMVLEDPVAEALEEIDGAVDERMRDDDVVEPPLGAPRVPEPRAGDAEPVREGRPEIAERPAKAVVVRGSSRSGFRAADVLIAVLALAVLGLSLLGLSWLFP